MKIRHRAIFPGLDDPSIVTATRLNFCVRHGNRCLPRAMGTDTASGTYSGGHIDTHIGDEFEITIVNMTNVYCFDV